MEHRLVFDRGALAGKAFRIPEGTYMVGRDVLEPRDHHISRCHFGVACTNGEVYLTDAGSANKTYVNGQWADQPIRLGQSAVVAIAGNLGTYTAYTKGN